MSRTSLASLCFVAFLACAEQDTADGTGGNGGAPGTTSSSSSKAASSGSGSGQSSSSAQSSSAQSSSQASTTTTNSGVTATASSASGGSCDPFTCLQMCLQQMGFGMCQGNMCVCEGLPSTAGVGGFGIGGMFPIDGEIPEDDSL